MACFSFHDVEQGPALRNPGAGGASVPAASADAAASAEAVPYPGTSSPAPTWVGWVKVWVRPVMPSTLVARSAGIAGAVVLIRRCPPLVSIVASEVLNAASTWAAVPSAATQKRLSGVLVTVSPWDDNHADTLLTVAAVGENWARN